MSGLHNKSRRNSLKGGCKRIFWEFYYWLRIIQRLVVTFNQPYLPLGSVNFYNKSIKKGGTLYENIRYKNK